MTTYSVTLKTVNIAEAISRFKTLFEFNEWDSLLSSMYMCEHNYHPINGHTSKLYLKQCNEISRNRMTQVLAQAQVTPKSILLRYEIKNDQEQ